MKCFDKWEVKYLSRSSGGMRTSVHSLCRKLSIEFSNNVFASYFFNIIKRVSRYHEEASVLYKIAKKKSGGLKYEASASHLPSRGIRQAKQPPKVDR